MRSPPHFSNGRPFFELVNSFLAATLGLGPVFDKSNPLLLGADKVLWYSGKLAPDLTIDSQQVYAQCTASGVTPDAAVTSMWNVA